MRELLFTLAWQSGACLALGLALSYAARRRPARAHAVLVLALVGALVAPVLTVVFDRLGWGAFAARGLSTRGIEPVGVIDSVAGIGSVIDWWVYAGAAWLVVSVALALRLVWSFGRGLRLARRAEAVSSERTERVVAAARHELGVRAPVRVRESDRVESPVVWCWGRGPTIVVPRDSGDRCAVRGVVCHELAHWRRRDHLASLVGEVAVTLLPWNPLAWAARRRLEELCERACDAWALSSGEGAAEYAESLLGFARSRTFALVPGMAGRGGLGRRVRAILGDRATDPTAGRRWSVGVAVCALLAVGALAMAQRRPLDVRHTHVEPARIAIPAGDDEALKYPVLVAPGSLDLGVVGVACTGAKEIVVVNTGAQAAVLADVEAGCGCTEIVGFEPGQVIPAGGTLVLSVFMTASELPNEERTHSVVFRIKGQPAVKLPVTIRSDGGDC